MSGIYIHIPFCKQACHYCNFHFSTTLHKKGELVDAIIKEITLTHDYLDNRKLDSIYFGGGTPSLLSAAELESILAALSLHYTWDDKTEITLEANPDDVTITKTKDFKSLGINRWSVGIQSFHQKDLEYMNRAHNAHEAIACLDIIKNTGFDKITIDLIYGTPTMNDQEWVANMDRVIDYEIPHISAYGLTVEEGTALDFFIKKGRTTALDPEKSRRQFDLAMDRLSGAGYEHYEISNYALHGQYAIHNTAYWQKKAYLGLGPAAHSFRRNERQWNVSNNIKYLKEINAGKVPYTKEVLSHTDQLNEYIMTSLRTQWGLNLAHVKQTYRNELKKAIEDKVQQGYLHKVGNNFVLTREGKHFADFVAMELFM